MITVQPDLLRTVSPDRTRNVLQVIVGIGDGCSTVLMEGY